MTAVSENDRLLPHEGTAKPERRFDIHIDPTSDDVETTKSTCTMSGFLQVKYSADLDSTFVWSSSIPKPKPRPGQLLVRVHAVALNPVDYKIGQGKLVNVVKMKLPCVLGRDFAGLVEELGPGGEGHGFRVGDRVAGFLGLAEPTHLGDGSFAEFCCPFAMNVVRIPDNLSYQEASGLPLVGCTSYQSLVEKAKLSQGQNLLILGGSTAAGIMATQIAKAIGCRHIVVTSSQVELCTRIGATHVINYRTQQWEQVLTGGVEGENAKTTSDRSDKSNKTNERAEHEEPDAAATTPPPAPAASTTTTSATTASSALSGLKFDAVYDCLGGRSSWLHAQKILKKGGHYVTIVGDDPRQNFDTSTLIKTGLGIAGRTITGAIGASSKYTQLTSLNLNIGLEYVMDLAGKGLLTVVLDPSNPYVPTKASLKQMLALQESGRACGKLIMDFSLLQDEVPKSRESPFRSEEELLTGGSIGGEGMRRDSLSNPGKRAPIEIPRAPTPSGATAGCLLTPGKKAEVLKQIDVQRRQNSAAHHARQVSAFTHIRCGACGYSSDIPPPLWICPGCLPKQVRLLWQPDSESQMCHCCKAAKLGKSSRHHCRSCGYLVCGSCSKSKKSVPALHFHQEAVRVCNDCSAMLMVLKAEEK
jgi:NADPH:quinone reductase-like Zn-dependent oxidoreductase